MNINEIISFFEDMDLNFIEIEISFIQKNKMIEYRPQISFAVKKKIIELLSNYIVKRLLKDNIVEYDPVGVLDNQIECLDIIDIKNSDNCDKFFEKKYYI